MPVITSSAVLTLLTLLGKKGLESAFENVGEKISDGAISWLKSLLYKEGKPKKALKKLQQNPDSKEHQEALKAILEKSIDGNTINENYLKEIIKNLPVKNTQINNKNINTGTIDSSGGNIHIGDNNG